MPTYEYECGACGNRFEEFQSMTARPLKKCPACGKGALERLIGLGAGIIFKGSGFYETDYRSESYKKAAEAEKGGSEKKDGHVHTGSCACGKKPAGECGGGGEKSVKTESAKTGKGKKGGGGKKG